ncbi:MAG: MFS transporter [Pseudomonadota bacterium]
MSDSAQHDSRYSWQRLAITLAVAVVGNVGMWAITVMMPAFQAEFGTSRADAAIPYTATMVGFAFGNLLVGRWVDRWGITIALVCAGVAISLGFAASALAGSITVLAMAQFIAGFGGATCFGPLIADISHWFLRRRGIAVAIAACGNYLAGAIWPLILGPFMAAYGWRAGCVLIAGVSLCVMVPMAFLLRRPVSEATSARAESRAAENAQALNFSPATLQWMLAVAGVACCVAMAMPQVHIVALCVDLGFGAVVGAEMLSLMLAGGVVSRLVSGYLADRLGGVVTLLIGSFLQAVALFLYLPFDGLVSLYLVSLVFGLSQGGIVPSYAIIVRDYMPAREAGARVGFVIFATIIGMALGGWMSGWIYDLTGSYQLAFINGIGWNALNLGIVGLILWRTTHGRAATA